VVEGKCEILGFGFEREREVFTEGKRKERK
jgi:hypothetical protein